MFSKYAYVLQRHRLALSCIAFAALTACGGNSSDPTVVAADFTAYGVKAAVNGQNVTIDLSGLGNCALTLKTWSSASTPTAPASTPTRV